MKKFMLYVAALSCSAVFCVRGMAPVRNQVSQEARLIDAALRRVATMAPEAQERELDFIAGSVAFLQVPERGLRELVLARLYAQLPPRPVSANPVYQGPTRRMPRVQQAPPPPLLQPVPLLQPTPQSTGGANGK